VDALREEEESGPFSIQKTYSQTEALMLYIEMIAHAHVDPDFITLCADISQHRGRIKENSKKSGAYISTERIKQYLQVSKQIEGLMCTSRESLLASSAWRGEFNDELKSRPFFYVTDLPNSCEDMKCQACNRSGKTVNRRIHLFGPMYNSGLCWNAAKWDQYMPMSFKLNDDETDSDESENQSPLKRVGRSPGGLKGSVITGEIMGRSSSLGGRNETSSGTRKKVIALSDSDEDMVISSDEYDSMDGSDCIKKNFIESNNIPWWKNKWPKELLKEKESQWSVADHCRCRTQMYHTLLHYKARLFLKIGEKLRKCETVEALVGDLGYMAQEVDRFEALIRSAGDRWGGGREICEKDIDLWRDYEGGSDDMPVDGINTNSRSSSILGFLELKTKPKSK
jgi:hypothetical protein